VQWRLGDQALAAPHTPKPADHIACQTDGAKAEEEVDLRRQAEEAAVARATEREKMEHEVNGTEPLHVALGVKVMRSSPRAQHAGDAIAIGMHQKGLRRRIPRLPTTGRVDEGMDRMLQRNLLRHISGRVDKGMPIHQRRRPLPVHGRVDKGNGYP